MVRQRNLELACFRWAAAVGSAARHRYCSRGRAAILRMGRRSCIARRRRLPLLCLPILPLPVLADACDSPHGRHHAVAQKRQQQQLAARAAQVPARSRIFVLFTWVALEMPE
jgi:hypothetical protein